MTFVIYIIMKCENIYDDGGPTNQSKILKAKNTIIYSNSSADLSSFLISVSLGKCSDTVCDSKCATISLRSYWHFESTTALTIVTMKLR